MVDELAGWELAPPVILADAADGEVNQFRLFHGLTGTKAHRRRRARPPISSVQGGPIGP